MTAIAACFICSINAFFLFKNRVSKCHRNAANCNVIFHLTNLLWLSLVKLLKDSGCDDKEFLKMIVDCCDNCKFCSKFMKPFSRPIDGFPVPDSFKEYVSMDLKEIEKEKLQILHLIDAATRYTTACFIRRKKKDLVVCDMFQIWVAYFEAPGKFHSNCGRELANDVLGIETSATPGKLLFSNRVVERNNKVFYEAFM